ncbi:hypothetical protein FUAX_08930 [Fulvitalea axinellae]|uniref:Uncharacterized protein n=1 Tax=Fulvitalea axinellae TaxID=1182444 RepID=A0AAU9CHZ2_9BACT|nr:hypothetical protein FUAX_08930 [Fulvitalea axinellae]
MIKQESELLILVEEVEECLLSGASKSDIYAKIGKSIERRQLEETIELVENKIVDRYSPLVIKMIERGATKKQVGELLGKELRGDIFSRCLKYSLRQYEETVRTKVVAEIRALDEIPALVDKYTNDFIERKKVEEWVRTHCVGVQTRQKKEKKNMLIRGLAGIVVAVVGLILYLKIYHDLTFEVLPVLGVIFMQGFAGVLRSMFVHVVSDDFVNYGSTSSE